MSIKRILIASSILSALCSTAHATNLLQNPDFALPSSYGATTSFTATDPTMLGGQSAAANWTIWAGVPGGRVITSRTPVGEAPGGYMLDVLVQSGGYGLVQAFRAPNSGPAHANACVWIRLVSGSVGVGLGNGGDTHTTAELTTRGSWQLLGTGNAISPANELIVYRIGTADAEFQVRSATVSESPIACGSKSAAMPETLVKPDPYPWTQHPEQGPASGDQPSAKGYFENMRPGTGNPNPAETEEHESGHDHGGGDKGGGKGSPNVLPSTANQLQQQQPDSKPQ